MGDKARAVEFFRQLDIFAARYGQRNFGKPVHVEHGGQPSIKKRWRGAVLHYTASDNLDGSVRWFMAPESKVSAHVVVNDRRLGSHDELADGLDMVARLPATVIQCRTPAQRAWHAREMNQSCYGVECVSAGQVRRVDDEFRTWSGDVWACPYKDAVEMYGSWWVTYPPEQIEAVVAVLRHLRALGEPHVEMQRPYVVGHDAAQANKRDPGPLFPIHEVRRAVFDDWRPMVEYEAWASIRDDLEYGQRWRDDAVIRTVRAVAESEGNAKDPTPGVAWARAWAAFSVMKTRPWESVIWVKLALYLLGYAVTSCGAGIWADPQFDTDDLQSVGVFQGMAGLQVDCIAGVKTAKALEERLWTIVGMGGAGRPSV